MTHKLVKGWKVGKKNKSVGVLCDLESVSGTVTAVEKTLDHENICLYHKLGLHWRLVKRPVDGSRLTEYVLELQTLPKVQLMLPD
ncbi:hypothetical protein TELCIR_02416 [Teladorsagia circumcincta]|uniref:Uncharacterized protein n=1 Tax=Teladorsagia circumcincta TaxID=45464 RepID=A0A2G9UZ56_TELCI|nr:hypothetical protein TELCIR_02416 [Teladorsagia circumcincta]